MAVIDIPVGGGTFTANSGDIFNIPAGATGPITINGATDFIVNIDSSLTGTGADNGRLITFGSGSEPTVNIAAGVDSSAYGIDANGASLTVNVADGANTGLINGDGLNGDGLTVSAGENVTVSGYIDGSDLGADSNITFGNGGEVTAYVFGSNNASSSISFGNDAIIGTNVRASAGTTTGETQSISFGDNANIGGYIYTAGAGGIKTLDLGNNAVIGNDINMGLNAGESFVNIGDGLSVAGNFVGTSEVDNIRVGDQWSVGGNIDLVGGNDQLILGAPLSGGGPGISTIVFGNAGSDGLTVSAPVGEGAAFEIAATDAGWTNNGDGTFSSNGALLDYGGVRYQSFETGAAIPDGAVDGTASGELMQFGYTDADGDQITTGDDLIYGNGGNDTILGGAGNDTIYGGDGDDLLRPGAGSDVLYGEAGNDTLELSDNDFLDGGDDTDVLDATWGSFGETILFNADNSGSVLGGNNTTFQNIEVFNSDGGSDSYDATAATGDLNISTGADDDTILGGSGTDTLDGGSGNDLLDGGAGNDSITGGTGSDTIMLGDGYLGDSITGGEDVGDGDLDVLDASGITATGVTVVLSGSEAGAVTSSQGTANFVEIENFVLTDQADSFDGSASGEEMSVDAGAGNDTITGGTIANTLSGGDGDDLINVGYGADSVDGGTGTDTLSIADANDAFTLLSFDGDGHGTFTDDDGDSGSFTSIEAVVGSAGNDNINAAADSLGVNLSGGLGADTIVGGSGDDTIDGGAGADTLTGGSGADVFVADGSADIITDFDATTGIDGGTSLDNDFVDLSGFYNPTTLAAWNAANPGQTYSNPLGWMRADLADGMLAEAGNLQIQDGGSSITPSSLNVENTGVVCFTPNTRIRTPNGDVPIELLRPGDLVVTRDNGVKPILWIGQRDLSHAELAEMPNLQPVRLAAGQFGLTRDLIVSPQHGILLRDPEGSGDSTLYRARHLAGLQGGAARVMRGCRGVKYIHLLMEQHEILFSNEIATESLYPGKMAYHSLDRSAQAELALLFPDLGRQHVGDVYGAPARIYSRRAELPDHLAAFRHPAV